MKVTRQIYLHCVPLSIRDCFSGELHCIKNANVAKLELNFETVTCHQEIFHVTLGRSFHLSVPQSSIIWNNK